MGNSVLVLIVGGILIFFWGLSSLYNGEVYWPTETSFRDKEYITRGRIPALIHGLPLTIGGILGLLAGLLAILAPESDMVELLGKTYIILLLAGCVGSFLASAIGLGASAEETDPSELDEAARKQFGDKYGRW